MTDEKLTKLKEFRAKCLDRALALQIDRTKAQRILDLINRDFYHAKRIIERIDRMIAEEELNRRTKAKKAHKKSSSMKKTNSTWKKVLKAIEDLPEEQKQAILANLTKEKE